MHFNSEQRLDDGVLERGFTLGEIPGVLWTPTSAPAPLILVWHPGGLHQMYPRLAEFRKLCTELDPDGLLASDLSRRIRL